MKKIPYGELQNVPLNKRHDLTSFESTNADLNDFLKNNALADQEWMVSKTYLCYWKKSIVGYITLVTDTLEVKVVDKDDDIDIGRKLDKANLLLKSVNTDINIGFNNLNNDLNTGFSNLNDMLGSFIIEQSAYNRGQQEHNARLTSILEKLVEKNK